MERLVIIGLCFGLVFGGLAGWIVWRYFDALFRAQDKQIPAVCIGLVAVMAPLVTGERISAMISKPAESSDMFFYYVVTVTIIVFPAMTIKTVLRIINHARAVKNARAKVKP